MANAIVLVPTSFTSALTSYGYSYNPPGSYDLIVGKTYTVVWDETEYTVTAMDGSDLMDGAVFIGNIKPYYPEMDTGEPFLIGEVGGGLLIVCVDEEAPTAHNVTIYTEAEDMDIVLKDRDGTEFAYPATVVRLKTADGAVRKFVNEDSVAVPVDKIVEADFSAGDMELVPSAGNVFSKVTVVQPEGLSPANIPKDMFIAGVGPGEFECNGGTTKEIEPDFSAGDQTVTAGEDELWNTVMVKKPGNLVSENVVSGVNIAGIVGTFAGGGDVKFTTDTVGGTGAALTIKHRLGCVPDIFVVFVINVASSTGGYLLSAYGVSAAVREKLGITTGTQGRSTARTSYPYCGSLQVSDAIDESASTCALYSADETSITLGGAVYARSGLNYRWIAIGGLT